MLVFLDTTGAMVATAPKSVGRNSAAMSTIYIVAPFPEATISLSFRLPNGDEVNPTLADRAYNAVNLFEELTLKPPANMGVWSYAIPASVTRIAGTVTYTITTTTGAFTGTASGTFNVTPATTKTAPNAPTDENAWEKLLSQLSELYSVEETILGNTPVKKLDGETITTVTALLADLVALIGKDGAESPIGGSTTITTLLDWVKDEALRLGAIIGSGSIPFAETITEAINALNEAKVSKTTEASAIYGTDDKGNPAYIPYSVGVKYDGHGNATSIPLRDNSGHVKTADPIAVDDAVSLGYHNREIGAITDGLRELDNIVKGRSRALVFDNWEDALVAITSKGADDLQIGDAILIRDLGAPDAWISGISPNYDPYPGGIGVTNPFGDNALTFVVGWYAISPLESPKVNLDEYAKEDDLNRLTKEVENLRANIPPEYFVTDSAVEYTKQVPAAALPFAEVQEVGGMTHAVDGALKNAAVTALEVVGTNLLDLTPALNKSLVDNGDGTYTLSNTGNRFSEKFAMIMPNMNGENRVNCTFEIIDTNITDLTRISIRSLDANGVSLRTGALVDRSRSTDPGDYVIIGANGSVIVQIYISPPSNVGDYVTFRNPMIRLGMGYTGYKPYIKRTYPIPAEVKALEGWGLGVDETYHNRIDWEKKQYRREVGIIDMGDLSYSMRESNGRYIFGAYIPNIVGYDNGDLPLPAVAVGYRGVRVDDTWVDGDMAYGSHSIGYTKVEFVNNAYTDAASFKAAMSGRMLVYALATPIITDISAILPDDNFIEVEGGGIVTAVNDDKLAAPTKIEYQLKEATA